MPGGQDVSRALYCSLMSPSSIANISDGSLRVWRQSGERFDDACDGGSVHV